jgi:glycosyltransferase involved in cell wall biosynthesis
MKNNPKISFFIPSLRGGGAERVFVNLVNEFSKRGFNVDLVLAQKEGPYLKDVSDKVNIVDLKSKRVLFSIFPLIKYLRKEKPRVTISSMEHCNIIAVLASKLSFSKAKTVVRVASTLSFSLKGTRWHKRWLRKYGAMFFYRFADEIFANSKGSAEDLSKTLKISLERTTVIHNPLVVHEIKEKAKEENDHKWIKEKKLPVVLGVGRLNKAKDFPTLIKAFSELKREAKLIILGEGEERISLEKLIKELNLEDSVDMPGFVRNPYVYMSNANVYVLSSKWEGSPNTMIEAMACGVPVVSTNCPSGPSEILDPVKSINDHGTRNGKYGELVPVGDAKKLAEKIDYVLSLSEEKRKKIGERARKSVEERFSVEKVVDEYEKLYKELVKG